ncbi:LysM peptidoglycan-binding domain-containing protein [Fulvivirga lutimaris]|uniref:LysM peptidoglycan-binding domain-containing protein n=1 Tax=Fulvivirga lutimaris TaxID=1819566 RepID=UPI0012BD777E|nr:LysM peptidoglycan-binding domain-containing protein [Fulvivirga lutimaris]MTI39362.1 LysM peptidoglycan-binding domain-containing protein [Fulvivirga lutimaris]
MRYFLVLIFCAIQISAYSGTFAQDSIGLERKDGKVFIKHEVADSETLYSLSRRYDVPIFKIIESNPPTEFGLEVGMIVLIPIVEKETQEAKPAPEVVRPAIIEPEPQQKPVIITRSRPVNEVIKHTVKPKETLFSISRTYEVSVADIKKWNGLTSNELSIGQVLTINKMNRQVEQNVTTNVSRSGKTHVVMQSETLFSISRKYDVEVSDIKKWNDLESNEISIGQELIVGNPDVMVDNTVVTIPPPVNTDSPVVKDDNVLPIDTTRYVVQQSDRTNFEEVIEAGLAEKIPGGDSNRKYLALHRSARPGTIMKVRNEMNNQEVFVRVIGKLPNTDVNQNVVIKISRAAYDRLGAIDPRFRVTVSYIP